MLQVSQWILAWVRELLVSLLVPDINVVEGLSGASKRFLHLLRRSLQKGIQPRRTFEIARVERYMCHWSAGDSYRVSLLHYLVNGDKSMVFRLFWVTTPTPAVNRAAMLRCRRLTQSCP